MSDNSPNLENNARRKRMKFKWRAYSEALAKLASEIGSENARRILLGAVYDGQVRVRRNWRQLSEEEAVRFLDLGHGNALELPDEYELNVEDLKRLHREMQERDAPPAKSLKKFSYERYDAVRKDLGDEASEAAVSRELAKRWEKLTGLSAKPDTIARHLRNRRLEMRRPGARKKS